MKLFRTQYLIKKSIESLKSKGVNNFTKKDLINESSTIDGGRQPNFYEKIKSEEDIINQRYVMVNQDGHYPAGISDCEVVVINGDCGIKCPVFLRGDCRVEDLESFVEEIIDNEMQEIAKELYADVKEFKDL